MSFILPGGLGQLFAVPGFSGFSPTRNAGSVTFSNGNKTITGTGTKACPCAGTKIQSAGKFYFEMTFAGVDPYGDFSVGLVSNAWTPTDANWIGAINITGNAGVSAQGNWIPSLTTGYGNIGSGSAFTGPVANNGDIIGVAADFGFSGSLAMWYRQGANWFNAGSPTTTFPSTVPDITITGTVPAAPAASAGMAAVTINTGGSAFANAPPAGFVAWG